MKISGLWDGGEKRWPIIIGGFYRSGTTLVRRLFDAHSQVFCGPEVKFWRDFYGDYQSDPYAHIRFFQTARSLGLAEDLLRQKMAETYVALLEAAALSAGKLRWADKNPENLLYLDEWNQLLGGRFYFVFVVRNPLDSLASVKEVGFEKTLSKEFSGRVKACKHYLESGIKYLQAYPKMSYVLNYEKLVSEPESMLTNCFEFCRLSYEQSVLDDFFSEARGVGIEDPKAAKSTIVYTTSVNRWEQELTEEEVALAKRELGFAAAQLGYNL